MGIKISCKRPTHSIWNLNGVHCSLESCVVPWNCGKNMGLGEVILPTSCVTFPKEIQVNVSNEDTPSCNNLLGFLHQLKNTLSKWLLKLLYIYLIMRFQSNSESICLSNIRAGWNHPGHRIQLHRQAFDMMGLLSGHQKNPAQLLDSSVALSLSKKVSVAPPPLWSLSILFLL